jgi:hypothetical protein
MVERLHRLAPFSGGLIDVYISLGADKDRWNKSAVTCVMETEDTAPRLDLHFEVFLPKFH